MKFIFALVFAALSLLALAQEVQDAEEGQESLIIRHTSLCIGQVDCRINIIPQKQSDVAYTCSGKILDLYKCDINVERVGNAQPKIRILCQDLEGKGVIDRSGAVNALTYNVAAITTGFTGEEMPSFDPKSYVLFSNSTVVILLSKQDDVLKVETMKYAKDDFTEVTCR